MIGIKTMITRNEIEELAKSIFEETKGNRHYRRFSSEFVDRMLVKLGMSARSLAAADFHMFVSHAERGYSFGTEGFFNNLSFNVNLFCEKTLVS